jgi:hypothetical protein
LRKLILMMTILCHLLNLSMLSPKLLILSSKFCITHWDDALLIFLIPAPSALICKWQLQVWKRFCISSFPFYLLSDASCKVILLILSFPTADQGPFYCELSFLLY